MSYRLLFGLSLELFENEKICVLRDSLWKGKQRHVLSRLRISQHDDALGCCVIKCMPYGKNKFELFFYCNVFGFFLGSPVSILSGTGLERDEEKMFDRNGDLFTQIRFETDVKRRMVSSIPSSLRSACKDRNHLKYFKRMAVFGSDVAWMTSRALLHMLMWSTHNGARIVLPSSRSDLTKLFKYVGRTHYGSSSNFQNSRTLDATSQQNFLQWRGVWQRYCSSNGLQVLDKPEHSGDTEKFVLGEIVTNTINHLSSFLLEKITDDFYHHVEVYNSNHPNAVLRLSKDLAKNAARHALANTPHFEDVGGMDVRSPLDAPTLAILRFVSQTQHFPNMNGFRIRGIAHTNRFKFVRFQRVGNRNHSFDFNSWTDCFELLLEIARRADLDGRKRITVFPQAKVQMHTVRVSAYQFKRKFGVPISSVVNTHRVVDGGFKWYVFFF